MVKKGAFYKKVRKKFFLTGGKRRCARAEKGVSAPQEGRAKKRRRTEKNDAPDRTKFPPAQRKAGRAPSGSRCTVFLDKLGRQLDRVLAFFHLEGEVGLVARREEQPAPVGGTARNGRHPGQVRVPQGEVEPLSPLSDLSDAALGPPPSRWAASCSTTRTPATTWPTSRA